MKAGLWILCFLAPSVGHAQQAGPRHKLHPDVRVRCETCPGAIAYTYRPNYYRHCGHTYSRVDILRRRKHRRRWYVNFSLLYRQDQETGQVYSFPVTDTLKVKPPDCVESLIFDFADAIGTKRMGGESGPNEFPWILVSKQPDAGNDMIYTYRVGYLIPSSSAYLECLAFDRHMNLRAVLYDTEYTVPGKQDDTTVIYSRKAKK